MKRHVTSDELLRRLYGVGETEGEVGRHLDECIACAQRWREFERRREETASVPAVSAELLASQRRRIYARLEEPERMHVRWAPALVAVSLLAVGVLLYAPGGESSHPGSNPKAPVAIEINDEQLFSDVYSMEQTIEPRAAAPIHALFEISGGEEGQ